MSMDQITKRIHQINTLSEVRAASHTGKRNVRDSNGWDRYNKFLVRHKR